MSEKQYYLQDKRQYVGNDMLFWCKDSGYTTDVSKAAVFSYADAYAQHGSRRTDVPWPKEYIDSKIRPVVDVQNVNHDVATYELTSIHKTLLQHMLGADSRYKKNQWGFRNHFCSSKDTADDINLREMVELGLAELGCEGEMGIFYHATKLGAITIGFKKYQLRNASL